MKGKIAAKDLPEQEFEVYKQINPRSWWQRQYLRGKGRKVWVPVLVVTAPNPWRACRIVRETPTLKRHCRGCKLKAMPTWRTEGPIWQQYMKEPQ